MIKIKAKDSDDEDYMVWKKPDLTAPIVTFTPPPDDAAPSSSFRYKTNILTKKQLESFNVRQNQQINIARALADGDDGFESLNGYNSNGSEGDRGKNETENVIQNAIASNVTENIENKPVSQVSEELNANIGNDPEVFINADILKKDDDEKSIDADSDGVIPTSSPSTSKRIGVRFRSSWAQDGIRESSDDDFTVKKKEKVNFIDRFYYFGTRNYHLQLPILKSKS